MSLTNIFCTHFDGWNCTNFERKKKFLWFTIRDTSCCEFISREKCSYKNEPNKPSVLPPKPPVKKVCPHCEKNI